MPQDLNDYIKTAREHGSSDAQIRDSLVGGGWDASVVDAALTGGAAPAATPESAAVPKPQAATPKPTAAPAATDDLAPASAPPAATPVTPATSDGFDPRSGKGAASEFPSEAQGFNWGALWLTFIWGLFNRVWISLVVFVPIVGAIWFIILGVKGNEWAWRAKQWPSVEHFHRIQKKWAIAGWVLFALSSILMLGGSFFASTMLPALSV
jgi:hypothetical protein